MWGLKRCDQERGAQEGVTRLGGKGVASKGRAWHGEAEHG